MKKKMTHDELEREEEKTGIDIDHDDEKGEPAEHKEKVEKARRKKFKEWLLEREDVHDKPGGSNVGKERKTSGPKEGPFCGPSGGSPKGSFPVTNKKQWRAAKAYSHDAPEPQGIKNCADRIAKRKGWTSE